MSGIMSMLLGARTAIAAAVDEFFNRVTLLLPGDGTNGAQNNTFLDSSTNNFTITRNGNTTQGTFSPFSQTGWSNYFSSSAYLSSSNNITQTGNFTVEGWVYTPSRSAANAIFTIGNEASGRIIFYINSSNQLVYSIFGVGDTNLGGSVSTESWVHVAFVRSSTTVTAYINGVATGTTGTLSGTVGNSSAFYIAASAGGTNPLTGYISNVRVTNAALYTSTFTPSTTPLTTTVSTGTVALLTCQSNRFIDNSSNAFVITVNGSPSVQAFSPFAPTTAYSAATVGGSGYFDGTGDMLETPSITIGTNNFCFECWLYPTVAQGATTGIFTADTNGGLQLSYFGNPTTGLGIARKGVDWDVFNSNGTQPIVGQWNHVAYVRSGTGSNQTSIFLNGTRIANGTSSSNYAASLYEISTTNAGGTLFVGYISGARLTNGSTPYDATQSTITIPTAPLTTSASNTTLLLNFTNAGITDATAKNVLETVGNAQISTAQSKFGGSSMYFDGTGDYLVGIAANAGMNPQSGDFTVEFWAWIPSLPNAEQPICATITISGSGLLIGLAGGGNVNKIQFAIGNLSTSNPTVVDSSTFPVTTWTHIAAVRSGGTIYLYKNGTSVGTPTSASVTINQPTITIGAWPGGSAVFNGYIDDLRITRYARYTSNFTPPTAAFALQ